MKSKLTRISSRLIPASLAASLMAGLSGGNLYARNSQAHSVSQTNIVFGTDGVVTNSSAGYAGTAAAVWGFGLDGILSGATTSSMSLSGDAQEAAQLELNLAGGLAGDVSHATVVGQREVTASEASLADISLTGRSGFFNSATTTVAADFVMSQARAACSTNEPSLSGASQISGLLVNGQPVIITGEPNQFVPLSGGGFLIINEQFSTEASTSIDGQVLTTQGIGVNALHVFLWGAGINAVFASSAAGIACGNFTNQVCGDFVTGGGWITGTPSGAKANFGVAGGIKNGAFWGHLSYIDHGNGMQVKATAVTGYTLDPNDPDCRIIDYNVTINGQDGTAEVRACDKGEPGGNDIFEIQLSNGYAAGGDLGSYPGGGNIQLHKCDE